MAVRRLAPDAVQPPSFAYTAENAAWAEATIAKYPEGKQASAVIPLLMRAQDQDGWVSKAAIEWTAEKLGMARIRVLEVATFYTQFQLAPVGSVAHVQVCGTTPCMLRGSDDIKKVCQSRIHHDAFHLSEDGKFSWEEVECLGACVNAPMVAVFKDTFEDLTVESFNAVLDAFARGETPTPGPQNGRQGAVPEGGQTTLTDPGLYNGAYRVNIAVDSAQPPVVMVQPVATPGATAKPDSPVKAADPAASAAPIVAPASSEPTESVVSDEFKPELLTAARGDKGDNLQLIKGIGPKLEELLHTMGVWHFDQISAWTEMNLKWVDQNLGTFKGRAVRDNWIAQAQNLAAGGKPAE